MSGSAGGNRIPRAALQSTVNSYVGKVLKKFPGFKSAKISGSYNTTAKQDFGDIDLIVNIESGKDKKTDKQDLVKYLESLSQDIIVPFKSEKNKGKRTLNHGEIVTILYPIDGVPGEYVQIDNIISSTEDESNFKKNILDYPAEKQGLILGLVKAVLLEEDPKKVFAKMGITNLDPLEPNQEYEFHVSPSGLSLRKVTLDDNFKTLESTEMWSSSNFNDVKKLLSSYKIDGTFEELIQDVKNLKNPRSKNRVKGWFLKNIRVQAGETGTPKAEKKQQAIDTVSALQEKYGKLATEIAIPFLLENENKTIAIFPGKFKPPHKDHLARIQAAASAADEVLVIIGPKPVDSFTAEQSLKIFNLYKKKGLVPNNVTFEISDLPSPVLKAYKEFENNPEQKYIAVFGKDDADRFKGIYKLPNVRVDNFEEANIGNLSATDLRNAIVSNDSKEIAKFLPQGIKPEDFLNALKTNSINENASYSKDIDYKQHIKELTKDMIRKGMNIFPLPKVIFKHSDVSNAKDFFGKTAYYEPQSMSIVLYTEGRHPKDIVRSFAHEMIHHMQNVEGRLGNITTTNTQEDDYLNGLEAEANLKGTMTFRNWTDSLQETKYNYPITLTSLLSSQLHEMKINEIKLNPENAVETYGDLNNGDFTVGDYDYNYRIINIENNPYNSNSFYNIDFSEIGNNKPDPSLPTGNARENYIKILSTMYKIILDFVNNVKPEYIGISSLDDSGYWNIYNNLIKTNPLQGYSRKNAGLEFKNRNGKTGKFIILKKNNKELGL